MDADEMIEVLEGLIRDPETNATARCTAIRTLRQIQGDPQRDALDEELDRMLERDSRGD